MLRNIIIACAAVFPLIACGAQLPPLNFSPPNVGPTQTKLGAEVKSITVTVARPDEATGKLAVGVETATPIWKTALEEALTKMAIFQDDSPKKVSLAVKILKVDIPEYGASFTTGTAARYELIDRATGSIIFTTDVSSEGYVPGDYAFMGVIRSRESVNRSVQNNIIQFLQQLETVNLNRPMFPVANVPMPAPGPSKALAISKGAPAS